MSIFNILWTGLGNSKIAYLHGLVVGKVHHYFLGQLLVR